MRIRILILAVLLLGTASLQAQEKKEKLSKEEKKAKKELARAEKAQTVLASIGNKSFVIESHSLYNRYGSRRFVPTHTTFISVNNDELTIQVGTYSGVGSNGLGGFTTKGRVNRYEVSEIDDKGNVNIRVESSTILLGHISIFITVSSDGSSRARLSTNFGGRLTFEGDLVDLEESRVYEGFSIF